MPINFHRGPTPHARGGAINCPHCGGPLRTRTNRAVTNTYRQLYLVCADLDCHATFSAALTIEHQIAHSLAPNPTVNLRFAPPRKKAANDNPPTGPEVPVAANDDDGLAEATG